MRFSFYLIAVLSLLLTLSFASLRAQVSGIINAPNGKPVGGTEVFINHTTLLTTTDEFGQFALTDVPPGFHEIVAYKKGVSALSRANARSGGQIL